MRSFVGFTLILMALTLTGCASVPKEDLSYLYLEEVRGEQALQWVESENQRTLQELVGESSLRTKMALLWRVNTLSQNFSSSRGLSGRIKLFKNSRIILLHTPFSH